MSRHRPCRLLALLAASLYSLCLAASLVQIRWQPTFAAPRLAPADARGFFGRVPRSADGASSVEAATSEADKGDGARSLEAGYLKGEYGVTILALPKIIAAAKAVWVGAPKSELGALQTASVLLVAAITIKVMRSAASRDRLGGTTFKVVNVALLGAFATIFCDTTFQFGKLAATVAKGSLTSASVGTLLLTLVGLGTAGAVVSTAYKALMEHGVPSWKLTVISKESPLLSVLAVAYAVTALHSVWWGSVLTLYSPLKTFGALRCFVVAALAYVCQTAAVAGTKRLASETYRQLNLALVLDSGCRLYGLWALSASPTFFALPALALASSSAGWLTGKLAAK